MGGRRETRRMNWRVREAVGVRTPRERERSELAELLDRADPSDFERIFELLEAERTDDEAPTCLVNESKRYDGKRGDSHGHDDKRGA
jgi:hypothetical protein